MTATQTILTVEDEKDLREVPAFNPKGVIMYHRFGSLRIWSLPAALVLGYFLLWPAPLPVKAHNSDSNYVLNRLNSAERRAAVEEMARKDAAQRTSGVNAAIATSKYTAKGHSERSEESILKKTKGGKPASSLQNDVTVPSMAAIRPAGDAAPRSAGAPSAPRPLSYILLEQGASFLGVPAPMLPGADEGLGFHQDGTVRKAGGSGNAGPSDGGMRAASYARSGLGYDYGRGYVPLSGIGYDHLTGRYDPARDGRRSYERRFDGFDPVRAAQDRVLSWGIGAVNSAGEAAVSSLVDNGRARLNFTIDWNGYFQGEGDVLLPFYDSQYTTIFTQIGARSMAVSGGEADGQDRWIGNFGLGQRWFPAAKDEEDAGDWMVGYNAFFDNDFTRSHQRGGVGLEVQYDWLHLASNYYFPLSGWKGSYDFDSRFIEERPAEGWDARVKAYLPVYRNVAFTGAYTQWFGDHVGMFGHRNLEKDPRVWSYGVEYTPVPLVSGFLTQRSTERGKTDTEFGLNFTYHFGMPWDDQVKHSKVAELRTVSGSRHEFVDRENRIILEYRAKNAYRIEYLGKAGTNLFRFRVLNGFDEFMAGQTVQVTTSGAYLAEAAPTQPATFFAGAAQFLDELISVKAAYAADRSKSYVTDSRGEFLVELDPPSLQAGGVVSVTVRAGGNEQTFTLNGTVIQDGLFVEFTPPGQVDFSTAASGYQSTVGMTVKRRVGGVAQNLDSSETVAWVVTSNISLSADIWRREANALNGLTWGTAADKNSYSSSSYSWAANAIAGSAPSGAGTKTHTASLTDVAGSRTITVTVTVGDETSSGDSFTFGNGPLSVFSKAGTSVVQWAEGGDGSTGNFHGSADSFPAADFCGGRVSRDATTYSEGYSSTSSGFYPGTSGDWSDEYMPAGVTGRLSRYAQNSKLPKAEQLLAVAAYNSSYSAVPERKGAAWAAGWPRGGNNNAWTGEVHFDTVLNATIVGLNDGGVYGSAAHFAKSAAVCLR